MTVSEHHMQIQSASIFFCFVCDLLTGAGIALSNERQRHGVTTPFGHREGRDGGLLLGVQIGLFIMTAKDLRWKQRFDRNQEALRQLESYVELDRLRPLSELERQDIIKVFELAHELASNAIKDYPVVIPAPSIPSVKFLLPGLLRPFLLLRIVLGV